MKLLLIPWGVIHGFAADERDEAWILNVPKRPYRYASPDEFRLAWNGSGVPYAWTAHIQRGG